MRIREVPVGTQEDQAMDWPDEVRRESYIQYIPLVLQIKCC